MCLSRNQPTKVKTFNCYQQKRESASKYIYMVFRMLLFRECNVMDYGVLKGAMSPR